MCMANQCPLFFCGAFSFFLFLFFFFWLLGTLSETAELAIKDLQLKVRLTDDQVFQNTDKLHAW